MAVGIITGSGTHALPGFDGAEPTAVATPFGAATVTRGSYAGVEALHVSRHGAGHARLSNHVTHRANIWALNELGASAVIGCTACGAVDPTLELGSLVVFDDLHFISNRLPDGSLCTFFTEPGDPRARATGSFTAGRSPTASAARCSRRRGEAGHRRGTAAPTATSMARGSTPRAEIAQLAACGVIAVSQTAGPETVLCGELELPFALIGFVTDYANEVVPGEPTPVAKLIELMGREHRRSSPTCCAGAVGDSRRRSAAPGGHGLSLRAGMTRRLPPC